MTPENQKSIINAIIAFVKAHPKKLAGVALILASMFTPEQGTQILLQIAQALGVDVTGLLK